MLRHVGEAKVILKMSATELDFMLNAPGRFTNGIGLASLVVTGVRGVQLSDSANRPLPFLSSPQIRIVSADSSQVGLAGLSADSATIVTVSHVKPLPQQFRIRVADPSTEAKASLAGSFVVATPQQAMNLIYPRARAIPIQRRDRVLDLTLLFPDTSSLLFAVPLEVSELNPVRQVDMGLLEPSRTVSTLQTARLTFPELNGLTREIYPTEILRLDIAREGKLRQLLLRSGAVEADFIGTVHNVTVGGTTVMPSLLDWWSAQHAVALVWTAATYTLITLFAAWRWLRRPA
jgi:hypothetical protein